MWLLGFFLSLSRAALCWSRVWLRNVLVIFYLYSSHTSIWKIGKLKLMFSNSILNVVYLNKWFGITSPFHKWAAIIDVELKIDCSILYVSLAISIDLHCKYWLSINLSLYHYVEQFGHKNCSIKVSKDAKIRNWYNQIPHLTQDTNGKVTKLTVRHHKREPRCHLFHNLSSLRASTFYKSHIQPTHGQSPILHSPYTTRDRPDNFHFLRFFFFNLWSFSLSVKGLFPFFDCDFGPFFPFTVCAFSFFLFLNIAFYPSSPFQWTLTLFICFNEHVLMLSVDVRLSGLSSFDGYIWVFQ